MVQDIYITIGKLANASGVNVETIRFYERKGILKQPKGKAEIIMKLDLTKEYKEYYRAGNKPKCSTHQPGTYLTITGKGEPAGQEFNQKVSALYPVAYGVKKIFKKANKDFAVPKLEGLWWVDGKRDPRKTPRSEWCWKLMIRMPKSLLSDQLEGVKEEMVAKKKLILATDVKLESLDNGRCIEMMHVGPYSEEESTIDEIHQFLESGGYQKKGLHHEIYLNDPRKTAPEKMKTIIRQRQCNKKD